MKKKNPLSFSWQIIVISMLGQVWVLYSIAGARFDMYNAYCSDSTQGWNHKNSARMQNGSLPIVFRAANKTDSLRYQTLPSS